MRAIRKKKRLWKRDKHKVDNEQEKKTRNLIRNGKRRFEKKLANSNTYLVLEGNPSALPLAALWSLH